MIIIIRLIVLNQIITIYIAIKVVINKALLISVYDQRLMRNSSFKHDEEAFVCYICVHRL